MADNRRMPWLDLVVWRALDRKEGIVQTDDERRERWSRVAMPRPSATTFVNLRTGRYLRAWWLPFAALNFYTAGEVHSLWAKALFVGFGLFLAWPLKAHSRTK